MIEEEPDKPTCLGIVVSYLLSHYILLTIPNSEGSFIDIDTLVHHFFIEVIERSVE